MAARAVTEAVPARVEREGTGQVLETVGKGGTRERKETEAKAETADNSGEMEEGAVTVDRPAEMVERVAMVARVSLQTDLVDPAALAETQAAVGRVAMAVTEGREAAVATVARAETAAPV